MWIKTKIQDRPVIIYIVMEKINEESLLSRFSLVCLWLCWNNITQSPLLHSRSTRLAGTEYSTRNHRLLFYQSWNFSQSAAEEPNENLENDNIQEDTKHFNVDGHPHLALHVHDDHSVRAVTNYEMLRVFREQDDVVDSDVCSSRGTQRLKRAGAFCGLYIPDLKKKDTNQTLVRFQLARFCYHSTFCLLLYSHNNRQKKY